MTIIGCGWQRLCHGNIREVCNMWNYEKRLQYPINIKNCNPTLAAMIISQYGGLYFNKVYNVRNLVFMRVCRLDKNKWQGQKNPRHLFLQEEIHFQPIIFFIVHTMIHNTPYSISSCKSIFRSILNNIKNRCYVL